MSVMHERHVARGPGSARGLPAWLVAWFGVAFAFAGEPASGPGTLAALRAQMLGRATQPRFARAQWGIHVVSLDSGRVLFSVNGDKLFLPASTAKLFTGALALDRLGPDFRIRTSVFGASRPDAHGVLKGDLVLYGRGDPSLDVASAGGDWDQALAPLVEPLVACGLKTVQGDLVADESFFREARIGSGWEYDDLQWYYGAEVSALTVNNNAIEVVVRPAPRAGSPAQVFLFPSTRYVLVSNAVQTVPVGATRRLTVRREPDANVVKARGSIPLEARPLTETVAVRGPAAWLAREFQQALARRGITVRGQVRTVGAPESGRAVPVPAGLVELGGRWSPPLRELLPRMMKPSQNLHAQLFLLQVGAALPPGEDVEGTSEQAGLAALATFVVKAGLSGGEVRLEEGSGLSRHNLVTPRALVGLLQFMRRHPSAGVFVESLPMAGVDGTLRTRMRGTPAEGNLRAKTGSLNLVNTLAGYVTTAAGEPLAFALLLNNYAAAPEDRPGRAELDDLAVLLAGLSQHTRDASAD